MIIRPETPADQAAVHTVIAEAFGQEDEALLVDALRRGGDLVVSLVAEAGGVIVGHVALSRLISPQRSLALAPVCVVPSCQGRGTGSALVRAALEAVNDDAMVFVVGEPEYYGRFGFSAQTAAPYPSDFAGPHFMAIAIDASTADPSPVIYPKAFAGL